MQYNYIYPEPTYTLFIMLCMYREIDGDKD